MTVAELAEKSGISKSTINRIENDESDSGTNRQTAEAIAEALRTKMMEIFHPHELSHKGRPPHTGRPITPQPTTSRPDSPICTSCKLELPRTGVCDNCS